MPIKDQPFSAGNKCKSFAEKLCEIKGKTIQNVVADWVNAKYDAGRAITLFFEDGSEITFVAGCNFNSGATLVKIK